MEKKGRYLRVHMFEGPEDPDVEEEWNRLYNAEHVPLVVKNRPKVIRAYRYVAVERDGVAPKYLTVYELETPVRATPPEVEKIIRTHWSTKMQPNCRDTGHGVYRQIYPEE